MTQEAKKFTWADLKRIANEIPEERLSNEVKWWGEERGGKISGVQTLEEDYHDDGDSGTMPRSIMLENIEPGQDEEDFPLIHAKGTRILDVD